MVVRRIISMRLYQAVGGIFAMVSNNTALEIPQIHFAGYRCGDGALH